MLLTAREVPEQLSHWLAVGGQETLESYDLDIEDYDHDRDVFDAIPEEHLKFIDECLPHYETDDHLFLHANYVPNLPLKSQPEFTIFWEHLSLHVPPPHVSGKRAIVGHTPQTNGKFSIWGMLSVSIRIVLAGAGSRHSTSTIESPGSPISGASRVR